MEKNPIDQVHLWHAGVPYIPNSQGDGQEGDVKQSQAKAPSADQDPEGWENRLARLLTGSRSHE